MPATTGLLETAIYAKDLTLSAAFYERVLGLGAMLATPRLVAFDTGGGGVLLVFAKGASADDIVGPRGTIPGHDGRGKLHFALSIAAADLAAWRGRLASEGVAIIGEYNWPLGGASLYFHDPDGHVVELATPGVWANGPAAPATRDVAG